MLLHPEFSLGASAPWDIHPDVSFGLGPTLSKSKCPLPSPMPEPPETYGEGPSYIVYLSEEDIKDTEAALRSFQELGLGPNMLEPATFPLSTELGNRLRSVSTTLHEGIGFAVLRGLNPKRYNDEENLMIYAGLVSWIGSERVTNPLGMSTEHIRNATLDGKPEGIDESELEPAKQPHKMNFHADRFMADILALHVREKAASGGEQYIASFQSIYNELMVTDPEVLAILAKDWDWPPSPENPHSKPIQAPVIFSNGKQVIAQLVWAPFVKRPEYMTAERKRALTTVNDLATKMCVKIDTQVGDIQLMNNLAMIHARESFTDTATKRRHLVRLGIRDPEQCWKRPKGYEAQFETAYLIPLDEQIMPEQDFDPWNTTSTAAAHYG
ncbi:Clavaminate synthase-like protein [Lentithecium fluviatile CBS 122367]|uniref:Clavaminate synthase-like protein n=1 Tax=Lentithecium fluviatile CBS 122367 TaxID=1168545 RepID=A0A6G1IEK5_9PLEO|nr:Clavaminate synthase-like protein [Lentithecium fluviatile CBS 122367]